MKVGIIGAGLTGCLASYYVKKYLPHISEISIFDKEISIGGCINEFSISTATHPLTIDVGDMNEFNINTDVLFKDLLEELDIKIDPFFRHSKVAVWDNEDFSFYKNGYLWIFQLLLSYGLAPIYVSFFVKKMKMMIYDFYEVLSGEGGSLSETDFDVYYLRTLKDVLLEYGVKENYIDDIVLPICNNVFDEEIKCFRGVNNIIREDSSYYTQKGLKHLCRKLLVYSKAKLLLGKSVSSIWQDTSSPVTYKIHTDRKYIFDYIIIAAPQDNIDIKILTFSKDLICTRQPQNLYYVSIVLGKINRKYFKKEHYDPIPTKICSNNKNVPFTEIKRISSALFGTSRLKLWRVTSRKYPDFLEEVFSDINYSMTNEFPISRFVENEDENLIERNLYVLNDTEYFSSKIESKCISCRNMIKRLSITPRL